MDKQEQRYAIIIGIDDYSDNPLECCVNDANEIEKVLMENCNFYEGNVFKIISNKEHSNKDITGQYLQIKRQIESKFREDVDSILFYFAGHGYCEDGQSQICLQDSPYPILDIFKDISAFSPKVQIYIIDSCQSGSKVLTRSKDDKMNQYINSSEGAMFLYACRDSEFASEVLEKKHGVLTNYFLESIRDKSLYDEEGYLTFNRIVDYVQKNTIDDSNFKQTPVVENRISGYYPFAISPDKQSIRNVNIGNDKEDGQGSRNIKELRTELQIISKEIMDKYIINIDLNMKEYNTQNIDDIKKVELKGIKKLYQSVVEYVEDNKLESINSTIYKQVKEKDYSNPIYGGVLKSIDILNKSDSKTINYIVNFESSNIDYKFKIYKSTDINSVSFGLGYINYQAKWGIVMIKAIFMIDWDGEDDNIIKNINLNHLAIPLEERAIGILKDLDIDFKTIVMKKLENWNRDRQCELDKYRFY